jgi:hypothetical protein
LTFLAEEISFITTICHCFGINMKINEALILLYLVHLHTNIFKRSIDIIISRSSAYKSHNGNCIYLNSAEPIETSTEINHRGHLIAVRNQLRPSRRMNEIKDKVCRDDKTRVNNVTQSTTTTKKKSWIL